ncbi:MAG TPA: sigma-70 family RNA polymerase sigma factor [Gemmataceae bacterium]|jgi:RNA polymerase sigma factor (sigma-70 family)|nr:sigma-70 family RNA polymerase sigma factor [Gemmataceae bacterium]
MATGLNKVIDHLHQTLGPPGGGPADGLLLGRFAATRDEAAFAALVRRHGPMVLCTCRRVLGHAQDAEDAFQATFLVLAQKAPSVRRDTVAGWLHGVAHRVALAARSARSRRRARESQVDELPQPEVTPTEPQDWRPLLDRELALLREDYRSAVVLCDLEGHSRKEAARQLGVPEGTLSSRLARGRALLARRLAKCGVTLSAAALAALAREAQAAAPAPLANEAVRLGLLVAAGQVASVSMPVAGLSREVLKAMFLGKLKMVAATAVVLAALGAGGIAWQAGVGRGAAQGAPAGDAPDVKAPRKAGKPAPAAPAVLRSYSVPAGRAEEIGRIMSEAYAASPVVRITTIGGSTLLVFASPEDQEEISKQLWSGPGETRKPVEEVEAALKALREARDPKSRRRAAEALERAARQLGDQPESGKPLAPAEPKKATYTFEMRDKPWAKVIEWYSEVSGLPFAGNVKPTGTFTFIPARGKRLYTLAEITDILNEALLAHAIQKYLLVRRPASFTLLPADERLDPTLLPQVPLAALEKRGRTELVRVVLPLKNVPAGDLAPEVKKLLGPFGEVVALEKINRLVLQDTAGNLRRVVQTVQEVEARDGKKRGPRQE